jgi:hypothetical protein
VRSIDDSTCVESGYPKKQGTTSVIMVGVLGINYSVCPYHMPTPLCREERRRLAGDTERGKYEVFIAHAVDVAAAVGVLGQGGCAS